MRSCKSIVFIIVFIIATQKCPKTNPLWDQEINKEIQTHQLHMFIVTIDSSGTFSHKSPMGDICLWQNYPHRSVLITICPETGITWGLHWWAHETAPVKPLFCLTLVSHGVYSGLRMKLPLKGHCIPPHWHHIGFTLFPLWTPSPPPPHTHTLWSPHEHPAYIAHWHCMAFTLVGPWNCRCKV